VADPAGAQSSTSQKATADSAARARALNPVVTTATRDARELRKLPVSVTVIDTTTLARTSQVSLTEALRTVPGVIAGNLFGGDDVRLSIRGSGARGGFGVRGIGILLDGVPITEPDGQTRLDQLDLGAARSIEIVRGPGSAMYGGTASGGVVNVITRSGRELQGVSVRMTGGGFGFDSVNLRKVDLSAGGARGAFDAYLQASGTRIVGMRVQNKNDMNRANLRVNWTRQENAAPAPAASATRVGLDVSYSDLDMQIPGSLTDASWRSEPWAADPLNVIGAYARREQRWRFGLRASQGLGTRFGTLEAFSFGTARTIDHPIFRVVDQNTHRVQSGLRHAVSFAAPGALTVRLNTGLDVDRWYGDSRQWTNVAGSQGRSTPCVNDRVRNIVSTACVNQFITLPGLGTYTSADITRGKATLTAGARYDRVTYDIEDRIRPSQSVNQSFDQVSPRVAVRYDVKPGVSVYSSVARGFEVPTNSELTASPDTLSGLNTALRPSSLMNYEAGAKALLKSRVLLDVAVYRTNVPAYDLRECGAHPSHGPRNQCHHARRPVGGCRDELHLCALRNDTVHRHRNQRAGTVGGRQLCGQAHSRRTATARCGGNASPPHECVGDHGVGRSAGAHVRRQCQHHQWHRVHAGYPDGSGAAHCARRVRRRAGLRVGARHHRLYPP